MPFLGGCHEMVRDIKEPLRKDMDYDHCHACSKRIKHPRGPIFIAGHNSTRMPYVGVLPLDLISVHVGSPRAELHVIPSAINHESFAKNQSRWRLLYYIR
jgi:hypothetical protein